MGTMHRRSGFFPGVAASLTPHCTQLPESHDTNKVSLKSTLRELSSDVICIGMRSRIVRLRGAQLLGSKLRGVALHSEVNGDLRGINFDACSLMTSQKGV